VRRALTVVLAATMLGIASPAHASPVDFYGAWCDAWSGGVHIHGDRKPYARGTAEQECHGNITRHGVRAELQYQNPWTAHWYRLGYGPWRESYGPSTVLGPILARTDKRYCLNSQEVRYRVRVQQFAESASGQRKKSTHNGRSWWRACGQPGAGV